MKTLKTITFILALGVGFSTAQASDLRLDELFDSYSSGDGGEINARGGTVYSGGEFTARFNQPRVSVASLQSPSISASCGGVDMYAGSFGFMSSDEIVQVARGVAQGAAVYFFDMAIESICSSCSKTMNKVQSYIQAANKFARNSCQQTNQFLKSLEADQDDAGDAASTASDATGMLAGIDDAVAGFLPDLSETQLKSDKEASDTNKTKNAKANSTVDKIEALSGMSLGDFGFMDFEGSTNTETLTNMMMTFMGAMVSYYDSDTGKTETKPIDRGLSPKEFFISESPDIEYKLVTCPDADCLNPTREDKVLEKSAREFYREIVFTAFQEIKDQTDMSQQQKKLQQLSNVTFSSFHNMANKNKIDYKTMSNWLADKITLSAIKKMSDGLKLIVSRLSAAEKDPEDGIKLKGAFKEGAEQFRKELDEAEAQLLKDIDAQGQTLGLFIANNVTEQKGK